MAAMRVNPTRMELTRLKKGWQIAVRGHKLLKDKRDEMVRRFMELIKENKRLREYVEAQLGDAQRSFLGASLTMAPEDMDEALALPARQVKLEVSKNNIMSVTVPKIGFSIVEEERSFYPYGLLRTSGELDVAVDKLTEALPSLLRLAELEKTCNMLADEIEKTRRRVNALEYVMIPQLKETIQYITMKLEENERGTLIRLMKMKDMMQKDG